MAKAAKQLDLYVSLQADTRAQVISALKRIVQELSAGADRGGTSAAAFEVNWHIWGPGEKEALTGKAK